MIDYPRLTPLVKRAAGIAHSSFPSHHDKSDTEQQLWVWLLENKTTVDKLLKSEEGERADRALTTLLIRSANGYLREEDAAVYNYDTEDAYYYSEKQIKEILEVVFRYEDWQSFAMILDDLPKGKSDPSHGNDRLAHFADVTSATGALTDDQYNAIVWHYKYGKSIANVGKEMGIGKDRARRLLDGAVSAMQKALGQKELGLLRNPPEAPSRPRTTAAGIARTESQYEG